MATPTLGGVSDSSSNHNSLEKEDLARFAVQEHNKKENAILEFARLVKAEEQVVAGTLHHLTVEAIDTAHAPLPILALSKVIEDFAKFDMLLKLKRGSKEAKFKVEVHNNIEGTFHLNQMEQDH
ncbi:hypothetical protein AAC387_Pa02g4555 [Persea americana]